ncbi:hypothetical protein CC85DRAFT_269062 [Cutaneotrichosporon oleaginosum]|uniref:PCI domain-containing protein n=1 Tax=Cutaneotrichosporon oleaginosum TaxID=879819 RepID=A0A0J0XXJ2_9TREE|nr:uncharacterized protein CC85DRAFT_269062 [Cutaneotrichosporon oleaginosum]KLT45771.1 hypothetical protein CC85DRAFT_269062 [Cutaneotrichosporon oleaginosum]TXT04465.1 hypothetical protein COLE_07284 [Cutaneotrichosporon oleaginosum]
MAEHVLEPFLILARGTKGAGAAKVILDATAAPRVYTFGELLDVPSIKELEHDPTHAKSYRLLQLFAYGTLADYNASPDTFPPLSPSHIVKLKHLSLLSLALQIRSLPYAELTPALQTENTPELEALIIDTIYAGLLAGKIHHHEQVLHVDSVTGRDLRPEQLASVKAGLETWCGNVESLLSALDEQIAAARKRAEDDKERDGLFQASLDKTYAEVRKEAIKRGKAFGRFAEERADAIDVDEEFGDETARR